MIRDLLIFFLGWLLAKIRRAAVILPRLAWTYWVIFTPLKRYMLMAGIYTITANTVIRITTKDPRTKPLLLPLFRGIDARIYPKLKRWGDRVRSAT